MNCYSLSGTYAVMVDNTTIIAKEMTLDNAIILLKALMQEWWREDRLTIAIQREEPKTYTIEMRTDSNTTAKPITAEGGN